MEFDRRVQIRVPRVGRDAMGLGTGYLVGPRLVLTAAHVLDGLAADGRPGAVTVCQPDMDQGEFPAAVCWQHRDEQVDAALVEIAPGCGWQPPESLSDLLTRPPQRYGHLIGARPHPVTVTGFPRLQKDPGDGRRLDEQLDGRISPGSGALAGRYEVTSTTPTSQGPPTDGGTRWSGISGAAVLADDGFGGDLLCGIVRADRQADGGTRLTATPISHLLSKDESWASEFRRLLAEHTLWEPVLEPVEPAHLLKPATADRDLDSPASLLRADTEAVAFHGRDSEIADLRAWCADDPATIAVRVITGPGGQGKTRLARHLTDALSRKGWATGHLRSDLTDHDTPPDLAALTTALPLLLVVDYAETRPRLLRRLLTQLHRSRHRVRLLLLARSDGEWRTDALSATPPVRRLLAAAPVIPLGPLQPAAQPTQDRSAAFRDAARDLARLLPSVPSVPAHDWDALAAAVRPAEDLGHPRYDNALTLQLSALVALLQHGPRPVTATPGTPAEEILLEHEERFWEDSAEAPAFKLGLPTTTLKAAVAVAALCGAGSPDAATRVLAIVPGLPADKAPGTAAWLARLYPADPDRYWGSLQPDRIAEYHATRTLTPDGIKLPALLAAAGTDQQAQTITVLARAAIAHYNAGRTPDTDHVLLALDTALNTAPLSYRALQAATKALPYPSRVLTPVAVRLTGALAQADRQLAHDDPAVYEPRLAASLANLGTHLSHAGRRAEALTAAEEAVKIRRRLAKANPAAHEPDLALSLSNLGSRLSGAGHRAEALTAEQQAVEIYRQLAKANPAAYEPDLAASLTNLGTHLSHAGYRAEALTTAEEAAEIRRRLAKANPAAHEPDLARSLTNLGAHLSQAGYPAEALTTAEEAVDIYRRLAKANPAAYEPDLATSLTNLGAHLSQAGHRAEALTTAEEAADIYRRLAKANPAAYEPDLAASLSNLGIRLSGAGRLAEALTNTEEAMRIRRRLAKANPAAYEPDLARSLTNLGTHLSHAGHRAEALTTAEEAVDIYRRLAKANPAAYEPDLAASLTSRATLLAAGGDLPGALQATSDAVECYRAHITAMPFLLPQLHQVLDLQARVLDTLGRPRHADTVRRWLQENPLPPDPRK